ncbi:MAG: hypothetical protein K8T89_17040 [Planctomycetes bacterium]|nr:hypothetical protein [Planctomycetota bacterium]
MAKRWRAAAGILFATTVAAVGLLFLIRTWTGEPSPKRSRDEKPPTEAENRVAAESAKPILDAIHRFKHQNGLWPNDLDELVPNYVKKEQVAGWRYSTRQDGDWKLIRAASGRFPGVTAKQS